MAKSKTKVFDVDTSVSYNFPSSSSQDNATVWSSSTTYTDNHYLNLVGEGGTSKWIWHAEDTTTKPWDTTRYVYCWYGTSTSAKTLIFSLTGATESNPKDTVAGPYTVDSDRSFNKIIMSSSNTGSRGGTHSAKFHLYIYHYTCTLTVNADTGGTASGGGSNLTVGTSKSVTATPSSGYAFDGWYEGSTFKSNDNPYLYTLDGDTTLTAHFKRVYNLTLTPVPTGAQLTGAGSYGSGTNVNISAPSRSGYTFLGWYKDGLKVKTEASTTYTMPDADTTLEAWWAPTRIRRIISG